MKRYMFLALFAIVTAGFVSCGDNTRTEENNSDTSGINSEGRDTTMMRDTSTTLGTDSSQHPNHNQDSIRQRY